MTVLDAREDHGLGSAWWEKSRRESSWCDDPRDGSPQPGDPWLEGAWCEEPPGGDSWRDDPWAGVPVIGGGAQGVEEQLAGAPVPSGAEGITVCCNAAKDPCSLIFRGCELQVLQPVIHWFERRNWWVTGERVPREGGTGAVDRECWRVQAVPAGAGATRTFDLTRDQATGWWQVLRVSP